MKKKTNHVNGDDKVKIVKPFFYLCKSL